MRKLVSPGSLVLDIGANIGAHTLHLSKLVGPSGRVMAFEPTDFAFRKLRRNLELNPVLASRVEAYHCFLTAADGADVPDAIYSSWPLAIEAGLHPKHLGREMQTEAAQARSLDSILSERADRNVMVKLDDQDPSATFVGGNLDASRRAPDLCHGIGALCASGARRLAGSAAFLLYSKWLCLL